MRRIMYINPYFMIGEHPLALTGVFVLEEVLDKLLTYIIVS